MRTQAKIDRDNYYLAMINNDGSMCWDIEERYGLDGYPPELVTVGLNAAVEGEHPEAAIEAYIADLLQQHVTQLHWIIR